MINIGEKISNYVRMTGKESVLRILPVKSNLKGLKLAPLQKDTIALTPKRYASQGERLKDFYNSKGYPYLLPHQEWSDKKILEAVNLLGKGLDKLIESKTLNKKTLQKAIEKLAPELKGQIKIKDFGDLEKTLRAEKADEELIQHYLNNCGAMTSNGPNKTLLYFKFERLNGDKWPQTILKTDVLHEATHALFGRLQNTVQTDLCKNGYYKSIKNKGALNEIFNLFEGSYYREIDWKRKEITKKNMVEWLGFKSVKGLHRDFEKTLDKLLTEAKATGKFNPGSDKKGWKHFFKFSKDFAKEEKEAYQSNKTYREYFKDQTKPTGGELEPLVHAEIEKFFAQKWVQVNKQTPSY